jgi:exodeoxyribonuclease VII large subunit
MTLPLFPDNPSTPLPVPSSAPPNAPPPELTTRVDSDPQAARTATLSVREVAGLIHERLRPLTASGRRIVHAQWIRPGINAGARGFLSVMLADTQDSTVSIDGFIWERDEVQAILQQGVAFGCDLLDREGRCEVMLEATIDVWVKKTKPYLRIHGLNHIGMKGLRQQQREATLARLQQEGLLDRNKAIPWGRPALRVFCIGKRDSDGCRDAIAILTRSGFRFQWTIHNVAVQGVAAVPTLVDAFAQLATRREDFDVVLLIRGGGSELDLLAYDDYAVAQAVACCGLPVVTGLGHTADHSICDVVSAHALETPTAAARFLVDRVQGLVEQLGLTRDRLRAAALDHLYGRRRHLLLQRPNFVRSALSHIHRHQQQRVAYWHAVVRCLQDCLHHHRRLLQHCHEPVQLQARQVLDAHRTWRAERFRAVVTAASALIAARRAEVRLWRQALPLTALTASVGPRRFALRELRQHIHHVSSEKVRSAQRTLHHWHAHIQAASPDRYYALGLSYVTHPDGTLVRRCVDVTLGDMVHIHLMDGTVPAAVTRKEADDHR